MTEMEWLRGTNLTRMMQLVEDSLIDRKRRLHAVAACRSLWVQFPFDLFLEDINAAERYADDSGTSRELEPEGECSLNWIFSIPAYESELQESSRFLRDIFGNPFRPIAFDPAWRSEAAVGIARGIYEDRAFERLPILADALQDAGCEHPDILSHCREPGDHVRGCWVVDLVLGKE